MDWPAIASVLGERISLPIALLDRFGRIRFFNSAMEEALGWTRHEVEGTPWTRVCPMPETEAARWLEQALRGALRNLNASAVTRSGDRVVLELELALVGRGEEQGVLLTARRALRQPRAASVPHEIDYEIAVSPSFGKLHRLTIGGENVALRTPEAPCFALLYDRTRPCSDCPALAGEAGVQPQRLVRRRTEQAGQGGVQFDVTVAEPIDAQTIRLHVNTISEGTLEAIHKVKLDEIASQAGLSEREYGVLQYLLMGRSIQDIATVLEISPRTVKYHQANLLRKVGAD